MFGTGLKNTVGPGLQEGKVELGASSSSKGPRLMPGTTRDGLHYTLRHDNGHLDMARLLLDHGVDPNVQCSDLSSALHLASANNHLDIAELLLKRGASVDALNEKQETPLYQAAKDGQVAIVRLLIDQGANVHDADQNGWTALHAASHSGRLEVVKLLLRRGANVDILTKANKTAAELASENGQAEVARFIAEYKADANIRNKIRSTTMDTGRYGVDGDGKDEGKASLLDAAEEGNIDVVKSLLDRGADINGRNARPDTVITERRSRGRSILCACSSSGAQR
jgi:ankyrin repeat protein